MSVERYIIASSVKAVIVLFPAFNNHSHSISVNANPNQILKRNVHRIGYYSHYILLSEDSFVVQHFHKYFQYPKNRLLMSVSPKYNLRERASLEVLASVACFWALVQPTIINRLDIIFRISC